MWNLAYETETDSSFLHDKHTVRSLCFLFTFTRDYK